MLSGPDGLNSDERSRFLGELRPGEMPVGAAGMGGQVFRVKLATRSDITTGTDAAGLAAAEDWAPGLIERLAYAGSVADVCYNFMTPHGNTYHMNQLDSSSEEGGAITDQSGTTIADDNLPNVTDIEFGAYIRHSGIMGVRLEAIQDLNFDLPNRVMREAYRRLGRGWNNWFTKGTGSSQPQGIVTIAKSVNGEVR